MSAGDLNSGRRERDREHVLHHAVDVVVVGGGVTGAGIALDAATRGLSVALVEAEDLAFGTSRWSSKLAHGGLRYLAHGDLAVAWESAVERGRLMTAIAPHLTRALPHVMPFHRGSTPQDRALVRVGLRAADALRIAAGTRRGVLGPPRSVSAAQALALVPTLEPHDLLGATLHWDGQLVDDARLVIALARTAASYGAHILTGARVIELDGQGVLVRDAEGDFTISGRQVITAAGIWTAELDESTHLVLSRGSHALLDPAALGHPRAAVTVPVSGAKSRYVFALPTLEGPVIAGITDVDAGDHVSTVNAAPMEDVDWILQHLSTALARPLTGADVIGSYAGFRPLVGEPGQPTADISRRHRITRRPDGVITVTGGKFTTYRRMAADALDRAALPQAGPCRTASLPLIGAQPRASAVPAGVPSRLVWRYGSEAARVAGYAAQDADLLAPVAPGVGVLGVEVVHALRAEGATTVADVMERRTRLSTIPAHASAARERVREIVDDQR